MKKIGIYSGTFDPIHIGHVSFAMEATELFDLDRVYFLVEPRPRRKQGVKALEHRVKMVQLAVEDNPHLGTIIINQPQFTTRETMPLIASRFKGADICMLIGDDTLDHIAEWPNVDELVSSVSFIIGARKRHPDEVRTILDKLKQTKSMKIRAEVFIPSGGRYSSSQIKKLLRKNQATTIVEGLNSEVLEYIEANNLYFSAIE